MPLSFCLQEGIWQDKAVGSEQCLGSVRETFLYPLVEKIVHMCGFELVIKNTLLMYIYVRLDQIL